MTPERKTALAVSIKSAEQGLALVRFSSPDGVTPDKDHDITGRTAFTDGEQAVVSPFGHRSIIDGAIPAGRATVHRDGTADLKFFLGTRAGRETFETLKGLGSIAQYSYAYDVLEEGQLTPAMRAAGALRYLKRLEVIELSPCVRGAGANTGTLDLKACGCGAGSTCGCTTEQPVLAERQRMVREAKRLLAAGDAILAATAPPALSPEQLRSQLVKAQWLTGITAEVAVDSERRHAATKVAEWVAAQWRVHPPRVKFYSRHSVPDCRTKGFFDPRQPDSIWLRSDRFSWDLLVGLAHEGAHHARHALGLPQSEIEVELDVDHLLRRYTAEVLQ